MNNLAQQIFTSPENDLLVNHQMSASELLSNIASFNEIAGDGLQESLKIGACKLPVFVNEFWTSKQRDGSSLHEISYRACFKGQLPRFFIERTTATDDIVYDPFMGRGTTLLEAALLGRIPYGTDINPLSKILLKPRLELPNFQDLVDSIDGLFYPDNSRELPKELLHFYHPDTLSELLSLRAHLSNSKASNRWIKMVATNRLTGHSNGFFSVYTLPPNQAVSVQSQIQINLKRNQKPDYRDTKSIILKKTRSLLRNVTENEKQTIRRVGRHSKLLTQSCCSTPEIDSNSVQLVVTSPPFLDIVNYNKDNWLRCWFNKIDAEKVPIWKIRKPEDWANKMQKVFVELHRILKPNGFVAFEVGEVRNGTIKLEELVIPAAIAAGLSPICVMINEQEFTKTSHCWGISNKSKGTNSNRIVILQKQYNR